MPEPDQNQSDSSEGQGSDGSSGGQGYSSSSNQRSSAGSNRVSRGRMAKPISERYQDLMAKKLMEEELEGPIRQYPRRGDDGNSSGMADRTGQRRTRQGRTAQPREDRLFEEETSEGENMNYSIPTYPGVVPVTGAGYGANASPYPFPAAIDHGILGKDATFLSQLHADDGDRDILNAINTNSKIDSLAVADVNYRSAVLAKDAELRTTTVALENDKAMAIMQLENRMNVKEDGDATRQLLRDQEERRREDRRRERDQERTDATLAQILVTLGKLTPPV